MTKQNKIGNMEVEARSHINLDYLKETFIESNEVIRSVLNIFVSDTPELIIALENENDSNNWEELKMISHKLKNSFDTIGANKVGNMLGKIERDASQKNKLDISHLIEEIKQENESVMLEVEYELGHFKNKKTLDEKDDLISTENTVKILVVDDSEIARVNVLHQLKHAFVEAKIYFADTVEKAWDILQNNQIDLALVDIYLPGKNGADLINDMLADDEKKDIPIIVITGTKVNSFVKTSFQKYVHSYLHKPLKRELLISAVKDAVNYNVA